MRPDLLHRWHSFLTARDDGWPLSVFRLLWGLNHFSFGLVQLADIATGLPFLPYPGFRIFSELPREFLLLVTLLHLTAASLTLTGWHIRSAQAVLPATAFLLFFHSAETYQNHYAFYLFVTVYLSFAGTERYLSLDARRKKSILSPGAFRKWQLEPQSFLPQKLILLQTGFLYLFAGLSKLDPTWFFRWTQTPEILHLIKWEWLQMIWGALLQFHLAWIPLLLISLFMLFLSIGIFFVHRRPVIALLAITMHLLFDFHFRILEFTPMLLSILFLALFPLQKNSRLATVMRRLKESKRF